MSFVPVPRDFRLVALFLACSGVWVKAAQGAQSQLCEIPVDPAPPVTTNMDFGWDVAMALPPGGDLLAAIGAPRADGSSGQPRGLVMLLRLNPSQGWLIEQCVEPTNLGGDSTNLMPGTFGASVAIDDTATYVAVGMWKYGSNEQGRVEIFQRSGGVWVPLVLVPNDVQERADFGWSVDITSDYLVIGAPGWGQITGPDDGFDPGAVYVFSRSGSSWTQQQRLELPNQGSNDLFGWDVAIEGDTIVAGARRRDTTQQLSGAAYVFTRSGSTWGSLTALPQPSADLQAEGNYGRTVAIDGNTIVVGAPAYDATQSPFPTDVGRAYVFTGSGTA